MRPRPRNALIDVARCGLKNFRRRRAAQPSPPTASHRSGDDFAHTPPPKLTVHRAPAELLLPRCDLLVTRQPPAERQMSLSGVSGVSLTGPEASGSAADDDFARDSQLSHAATSRGSPPVVPSFAATRCNSLQLAPTCPEIRDFPLVAPQDPPSKLHASPRLPPRGPREVARGRRQA